MCVVVFGFYGWVGQCFGLVLVIDEVGYGELVVLFIVYGQLQWQVDGEMLDIWVVWDIQCC